MLVIKYKLSLAILRSSIQAKSEFRLSLDETLMEPSLPFQSVIINRDKWKRLGHGPFHQHKAMFLMSDPVIRESYQRILAAGGGKVEDATLHQAISGGLESDRLTHIIADPSILEPGDPRYREFQQWLSHEKNLTEEKRGVWSNGDGGTCKVFYTFLLYKLICPHKKIDEMEFSIFLKKIQKEARARARLRRQIKIKQEAEEVEAEVIILKEKIIKRKPGRTYLDQSRGGKPEVFRPKTEQKREAEWEEDEISSNGISGWKRKAKKFSGWSLYA